MAFFTPCCCIFRPQPDVIAAMLSNPIRLTIAALALLLAPGLVNAAPDHWHTSGYSYHADSTPLEQVLQDFADSHGVDLELDSNVSGTVSGRMRTDSATDFLERLSVRHRFQWFVYNQRLYVSPNAAQQVQRVDVPKGSARRARRALEGVGLLQDKFGWGELDDEGSVLVSGPPAYVDLVQQLIRREIDDPAEEEDGEVMIFQLRHASADDREITIRDRTVVIPGVATVLRNVLERQRKSPGGGPLAGAMEPLQDMETRAREQIGSSPFERDPEMADVTSRLRRDGGPLRVEPDVRSNAVLIRDDPANRSRYQRLIRAMDVPKNLIEIDAVIVDIDRSRLRELGVDWEVIDSSRRVAMNVSGAETSAANQGFRDGSTTLLVEDIGRFYANIRALESEGDASIIANPSVLTLENEPAVIDLSETVFIESVGERVASVVPVTAGTMLRVTPRKVEDSDDEHIQLVVDVEDGQVIQQTADALPRVSRNTISTKALVDETHSLVIGGYHLRSQENTERGIPFISDIPLLGRLFASDRTRYQERERLFILTPHISEKSHAPGNYSKMGAGDKIDGAVDEVRGKRTPDKAELLEEAQSAFVALARERQPEDFELETGIEWTNCSQPNINFDFSGERSLLSQHVEVFVGIAENHSNDFLEVDESACASSDVIAVAVWPNPMLQPGEKAEVFVARSLAPSDVRHLPSLLHGAR